VVYQLSNQRQNIVTKKSPGRPPDVDVVYQLGTGANVQAPVSAPPAAVPDPGGLPPQPPIRLAAFDGGTSYFSNVKPREATLEIVRPTDNPDLIWDPGSRDVIVWGDVVAYHVDQDDLASVIDRTAAVRELKTISTKAPQLLRLSAGDEQRHIDDVVQIELSDVAQRSIVLFNISGDGTVQLLYPLATNPAQSDAAVFRISLRVRRPYGADQIVAVTSPERLTDFEQAVAGLNRRRAAGGLVKAMLRYLPANTRIGSIGMFTAP